MLLQEVGVLFMTVCHNVGEVESIGDLAVGVVGCYFEPWLVFAHHDDIFWGGVTLKESE